MDEKRLNIAVRIVQTTLALEHEQDAGVRALLVQGLKDDKRIFGAPTHAREVHQRQAKSFLATAEQEKTRSYEQALALFRNAAAEALWGDDWETAVAAYRGWRWVKVRVEEL